MTFGVIKDPKHMTFWQEDWLAQKCCYLAKWACWDELNALLHEHQTNDSSRRLVNRRVPTSEYSVIHGHTPCHLFQE